MQLITLALLFITSLAVSGPNPPPPSDLAPWEADNQVAHLKWNDRYALRSPGYCPYRAGNHSWAGSGSLHSPLDEPLIVGNGRTFEFDGRHSGIDFRTPEGSRVYAAERGTVIYAGYSNYGGGRIVVLAHAPHWRTSYAHLGEVLVRCGQVVERGDVIALSGRSGTSWPHLHFMTSYAGSHLNPAPWLPNFEVPEVQLPDVVQRQSDTGTPALRRAVR